MMSSSDEGKGDMAGEQAETSFELRASPSHLLHRAQQSAVNISAAALAEKGLTLRQFAVLAALAKEEGQSQARLVDETGIDRSTLAEMVRRMEASGHIKRVTSKEDARAKAVSLMAKGRKAYEAALPSVVAADKELLDLVRANRRAGFLESLAKIGGPEEEEPVVEAPSETEPEPTAEKAPAKTDTKTKPKKSKAKPAKDDDAKAEKAAKKSSKSDKKSSKKKKKKKK
ncbi:MarR family winged helix-turn-helix transcriptional regulator [Henriciella sp. AS95]|uniref:MarR family winged helix-turn-helix transcriptional regulator n=1 Tax=Henriciella sp. AS95 TaxID=3135782 RepID=UPI00316FCC7A